MKIKLLMAGLLVLVSATTFAQKGELNSAQENYNKYASLAGSKAAALAATAKTAITDAKTSIDKASTNDKTATLPLTYALKGAIYAALAVDDTVATRSAPLYTTAADALAKAKELDTKGENKKLIDGAYLNMAQYNITIAIKAYKESKFEDSYKAFDAYRTILPDDTNAIYYTALSASNAGIKDPGKYYPLAITNYNKLVTTNFSGNDKVYLNISTLYLIAKDTTKALKAASDGVAKYPTNSNLRKREIEISLQQGKQSEILEKIKQAIANDPKNKSLYYYAGLTYNQLGDAADLKASKSKEGLGKSPDHVIALDYYTKAGEFYKKALEIDPDYFEVNMNYGYVLEKPAIDDFNTANKLPSTDQKGYEVLIAKANAQFDLAKPFLQKAVDLNPKSVDALSNLRNYYRGKADKAHAAENTAKAAELKKQIDALK